MNASRTRTLSLLVSTLFAVAATTACGAPQTPAQTEGSPTGTSSAAPASTTTSTPTSASTTTPTSPAGSDKAAKTGDTKAHDGPREKPKKISAAHVLIQYMGAERAGSSVVRTREQAHAVAEKVLERARAGDDFSRLAVDYSDEPGAAQRGGSLGRFGHGQMVRAFEEAAFALEVGQVSDIVETPFGYHVIKRTE